MKNKIIFAVMMVLLSVCVIAGDFKVQHPAGTDIFIIDTSGNTNASGVLYESNILISEVYWAIADVATPSNGDTTHLSTADQIYDYIVSLNYVANAWDALSDMTLNSAQIYVGDGSNDPAGVALSGDATISNTGVISVVSTQGLDMDGNITSGASYWNESSDLSNDELAEAKINFDTVCAAGNHLYVSGDNLACEADDNTVYTADAPLNMTGEVFGMVNCGGGQYYLFNATSGIWDCEDESTGGIDNIVEDVTPQLGADLDVNAHSISDSAGTANITVTSEGVLIII